MAEQDNDGHSDLAKLMLPTEVPALQWREVRKFFRRGCYAEKPMTITDAALAFHAWLLERGLAPVDYVDFDCPARIRAECLPYERPFARLTDPATMLDRAYIQLARYFRGTATDGLPGHSRISAYFVQDNEAPQSVRALGRSHGEHVVPCAVQRDIACEMFRNGHSVYDVAQLLKKLHVVIWIDQAECQSLDTGPGNLKHRMPMGWSTDTGCIYARLHDKQIPFEPPPSHPCTCGLPDA